MAIEPADVGALKSASMNRLACLWRHWMWADAAMRQFENEVANGWNYDDDPAADSLFGAYYHWCALLCGFGEAALDHDLLTGSQLAALRHDLEATLPVLRACRQVLIVIPASREEQPRIVNLLRDRKTIQRLRRLHVAFGEALREEQSSRDLNLLALPS